jgi:hypothetical protein
MAVDYYVMDYPSQSLIDVGALRWLAEVATDGIVTAELRRVPPRLVRLGRGGSVDPRGGGLSRFVTMAGRTGGAG